MSADVVRYDRTTVSLHWIVAIGVVVQWLGAHAIDLFPKGPLRVDARSVHIVAGTLLIFVMAYRTLWRTTTGERFRETTPTLLHRLAALVHLGLYVLLATVLALGMFNSWIRGDDIFGLFHLPRYGSLTNDARHALANRLVGLHRIGANSLLILAAGHAAAGLFHFLVIRDEVLQRMVPTLGSKRV